jgi:hypothetical protein
MKKLAACISAEMVKFRKSWPLLAAILAPICLAGFIAVMFWYSNAVVVRFKPGYTFWLELNFAAWNLIVLPAMAAIVSELSWAQDRDAQAWRHLLHQPMPRAGQFLAKLAVHLMLFALSLTLLFLALLLGGWILQQNEALFMDALDTRLFVNFFLFSAASLIPVVAFQTWFSFKFPGAGPALCVALAGSLGAMKLIGSTFTFFLQFLPWGLSCHSVIFFESRENALPWNYCYGALALAIALVVLGAFDFYRQAYAKSLEGN